MSAAENYDPAKEPCAPLWYTDPACYPIDGPGGNNTLTENNEKGILETNLFRVMGNGPVTSPLNADHQRVGIYSEGNTD